MSTYASVVTPNGTTNGNTVHTMASPETNSPSNEMDVSTTSTVPEIHSYMKQKAIEIENTVLKTWTSRPVEYHDWSTKLTKITTEDNSLMLKITVEIGYQELQHLLTTEHFETNVKKVWLTQTKDYILATIREKINTIKSQLEISFSISFMETSMQPHAAQ